MTLTIDRVLHNVVVSAISHYIDTWTLNGACMGHHTVLMFGMLEFTQLYRHYKH